MGVKEQFTEGKTQEEDRWSSTRRRARRTPSCPTYDEAMEMGVYTQEPEGCDHRARGVPQRSGGQPAGHSLPARSRSTRDAGRHRRHLGAWRGRSHPPIPVYTHGFTETDVPTDEFLRCSGFPTIAVARTPLGASSCSRKSTRRRRGSTRRRERAQHQAGRQDPREERVRRNRAPGEGHAARGSRHGCISQGAWHDADMYGDRVDKGGCINTLTTHRPSPLAKGNPQHSNICQVTKA